MIDLQQFLTKNLSILIITDDLRQTDSIYLEIKQLYANKKIAIFPDWEILPYDKFSPHQDIVSERLLVLYQLLNNPPDILIISVTTIIQRLSPIEFILQRMFKLAVGDEIIIDNLRHNLITAGYHAISQVQLPGQFAVRGAIIDLFPMGENRPFRIDLFDNEIETIRYFDPESQRSSDLIANINILPAKEFPVDNDALELFRVRWRENFSGDPKKSIIYQEISHKLLPAGIEFYFPLFTEKTSSFLEYLAQNSVIFHSENIYPAAQTAWQEINQRYEELRYDQEYPCLEPQKLYITPEDLFRQCQKFPNHIIEFPAREITEKLPSHIKRRHKIAGIAERAVLQSLAELQINDYVVHFEHGIGKYLGLVNLNIANQESEFVCLEYANQDKIYVPVTGLNQLSIYTGGQADKIILNKLGSDKWQKSKQKALEQAHDTAVELLNIYAARKTASSFIYENPENNPDYQKFVALFPFEATHDQKQAIKNIVQDLSSGQPMDRVICGDVGFGKTEVAMRAAFIVVNSGRQVAVLVPTTLLADQHFETFTERFKDFAIKVGVLSRFKTLAEQQKIIQDLELGKIDIIIATHKLIIKPINFKNLGLLVIDEEHRFGVKQKERLKSWRSKIDILSMTATPIPRTLSMSMASIRDLSIIATPPLKRLSVKTFVREYSDHLVKEAAMREMHRGGQIFYLHNNIDTIAARAEKLRMLLPTARIAVAHGQMRERDLEVIMHDVYHRRYDILVCTVIIETGIDIPTANTIIIERADKFGLAQLHQLRGRVGRSHHQAYAFLLAPPEKLITPDARKRLQAVLAHQELGAGFSLAIQDMEIRGVGALLGEEQSGHIQTIGYSLYLELLEQAVKNVKSGTEIDLNDLSNIYKNIEIDLGLVALIPDKYLLDISLRLNFYQKISKTKTTEEVDAIAAEMIDRFGPLPDQVQNLLSLTKLRQFAGELGIKVIKISKTSGIIEFTNNPKINSFKLITLIQENSANYKFAGQNAVKLNHAGLEPKDRLDYVKSFLKNIAYD